MKIFFAAPFTPLLRPDGGFSPYHRRIFSALIEFLKEAGHEVYSAHVREDWGRKLLKSSELVPDDFAALGKSELVVACLLGPISQGVFIELGWASAARKPMVIIKDGNGEYSPVVEGLDALSDLAQVAVQNEESDELIRSVTAFLSSYLGRKKPK